MKMLSLTDGILLRWWSFEVSLIERRGVFLVLLDQVLCVGSRHCFGFVMRYGCE